MHYVNPEDVKNPDDRPLNVNLEQELLEELPGIFNWALEGLQELLARGKFVETDEQKKMLKEFVGDNNHIVKFIDDAKKEGLIYDDKGGRLEGKKIETKELFRHYKAWALDNNEFALRSRKFFDALRIMLKRMNIEYFETAAFWKFSDIDAGWEALGFDDGEGQTAELAEKN